jgi:membrane protein implicated in regulation of membrane protease activity
VSRPPPLPKRPYRDTVLFNLVLAALIVLVSWATGGAFGRALVFAALFFVVATAWSWWRFRQRLAREKL